MKLIFKLLIIGAILTSCSNPERKGLPEQKRNHVNSPIPTTCENRSGYSSDLILKLDSVNLDQIYNQIVSFSDSVLGEAIIGNIKEDIRGEIANYFFPFEENIKNAKLLIDKRNLWNTQNALEYFNSDNVTPAELNWKNLLQYNSPLSIEKEIGKWIITQEMYVCIDPNWSQIGQFKKVVESDSTIELLASYGYEMNITINCNLQVENSSTNKLENYQFQLEDSCRGFVF